MESGTYVCAQWRLGILAKTEQHDPTASIGVRIPQAVSEINRLALRPLELSPEEAIKANAEL